MLTVEPCLEITRSPAYSAEKSRFRRWALLAAGSAAEGDAWLQAAWEAEDSGQDASDLRRRAAALLPSDDIRAALRRIDVLRRAGAFTEAADALGRIPAHRDEASGEVAAFQQARIAEADVRRYLISSAIRPAARGLRHVAPAPEARTRVGFWSWLRR